jgi:hypothetical protein
MENQAEVLGKHTGSHHGAPDLFERDIKLLQAYQLWVKTANDAAEAQFKKTGQKSSYAKDTWVPSYPDMLKSRLFWRIRSGKDPLPEPPPTAYSCSWYELIEVPGPHDVWEEIRVFDKDHFLGSKGPVCSVAQSLYEVLEQHEDGTLILKYNCYKFKAWNGMIPTRSIVTDAVTGEKTVKDSESPGGWIEYIGTV